MIIYFKVDGDDIIALSIKEFDEDFNKRWSRRVIIDIDNVILIISKAFNKMLFNNIDNFNKEWSCNNP